MFVSIYLYNTCECYILLVYIYYACGACGYNNVLFTCFATLVMYMLGHCSSLLGGFGYPRGHINDTSLCLEIRDTELHLLGFSCAGL